MNIVKTIIKNVLYLCKHSLYEEKQEIIFEALNKNIELYRYDLREMSFESKLKILNNEKTIELLNTKPKSFCRFGDGELDIINGKSIPFQKYDKDLAKILYDILTQNIGDMYVAINYYYFHNKENLNHFTRKFYLLNTSEYRTFLEDHCFKDRVYINAAFNQVYQMFDTYDFEDYFSQIKNLFKNKDIVVFAGADILNHYKYNVFDQCKHAEYIECPKKNAFSEYQSICQLILSYSKEKLLCFILGPTSKAFVLFASNHGYCAWDIGHMAKDYNSYMCKERKTDESIKNFYKPD